MTSLSTVKKIAIEHSLSEREKAKLLPKHTTKVGASIYTTDDTCYGGFNIQNPSHKSYHAEETALICCYLSSVKPESIIGIVVSFSNNDISALTFCCGHCRQMLWEYTHNPDLLITEVNASTGEIIKEVTLGELYPYPYPK